MTPGDTPLRKRNREATRAALLASARSRFARDGYASTNVRDIAADAGVDASLLFRYFGTKRKLFDECSEQDARATEAALDGPPEELPARLLESILAHEWPDSAGEHPFIAMLRSAGDEAIRDRLREHVCDTYVARLRELCDGPDADLRAELFSAWLLGISVIRSVVRSEALSATTLPEVSPHFERVAAVLLGKPAEQ
ncbi:TetR family transcriptional regulator [Lentzea sp. JNUCC 0626]|uniref:TetR/AcrR family transcriptional regulator n=1 Tax=Lentzea sp. JNUCC 0626 TaxID=3367513 RepID=UPI003748B4AA